MHSLLLDAGYESVKFVQLSGALFSIFMVKSLTLSIYILTKKEKKTVVFLNATVPVSGTPIKGFKRYYSWLTFRVLVWTNRVCIPSISCVLLGGS
jgi:hypothetical protein